MSVPLYHQLLFIVLIAALFGLVAGSFLNVVIHRVPRLMERQWRADCAEISGSPAPDSGPAYNLVVPRSACPHCGHKITALENIPIASYIALGGKCSACKKPISLRYPVVEALTAILFGYVAWRY